MERIRKGDEVIVITGKDKGKRGVVLTLVGASRVMVEASMSSRNTHAPTR